MAPEITRRENMVMKACILPSPAAVETNPLRIVDLPKPAPAAGQVLIRVRACGVCRTDLHVVEGELPSRKSPVVPGHQVVGVVEASGPGASRYSAGARVGVPWLHQTCGVCDYCLSGRENLCESAVFTGWMVDGGYAEYLLAPENFVYALPEGFGDLHVAPLLCAGIIGFRTLRLSGVQPGGSLAIYGFGGAAHIAIQVARHWNIAVYAFSRDDHHRQLAQDLGAAWAGGSFEEPPVKLDGALIFAPAGELVVAALRTLKRGGTVAIGGIHMSPIPPLDYNLLYHERVVRSVANNTRRDGEDFLKISSEIPIRTEVRVFPLDEANQALQDLKNDRIRGAAVLKV
ncbi:MAG TPA: zinc-dependent alcohol dehydrogenase family protein [Bryobacteraceae bacterium]|nr:zinc-dependent alcohol dehydrogenase family protein [Bryobacteraceae bacterium]